MLSTLPHWQLLALIALAAAAILTLAARAPYVGPALRVAGSVALLAVLIFTLAQQAPYHPFLAGALQWTGLDRQEVTGEEVRLRMSPDGHFWAQVTLNGVETRMLVDSGATLTSLSAETAEAAGVTPEVALAPILARTANGLVQARPGVVDQFNLGPIEADGLQVAITPALGRVNVLGMNFLVRLESWRVEGQTMILTPKADPTRGGSR